MTTFKKYFFIILLIIFYNKNEAQKTPDDMTDFFFKIYKLKGSSQALDSIFATNKYISQSDIKLIKEKIIQYSNVIGKYYGHELIIKKSIGESIKVYSYILKYERQPIRFILTFYKPNNYWKIHNFKISDDFISELESATIELSYKEK